MFRHARMGFSFGCRLVLHIVLLEPWWRWQLSSLQTLTVLCDVLKPSSAHICSRDLIYSRSLTHRLQPRLPRSHQDQRAIGSSESVILYWALEVCAAQRERKKERTSGGRLALTHLSALVLSHLSSRTSFLPIFFPLSTSSFTIQPYFHSSLLHSHFHFDFLANNSPLLRSYLSILFLNFSL